MNYVKFAAALHALADAIVDGAEETTKPAKGKGKAAPAVDPSPAAAAPAPVAPATAAAAPAPTEPAPSVPSVTKAQLNALVLKVAAKSREQAEAILAKFGHKNTVTLPQELWQPVFDAFEEEVAKIDAAAVQVAQASLV